MAVLHVKSPNGTTHTLDLATMNITHHFPIGSDDGLGVWHTALPDGTLLQCGGLINGVQVPNNPGEFSINFDIHFSNCAYIATNHATGTGRPVIYSVVLVHKDYFIFFSWDCEAGGNGMGSYGGQLSYFVAIGY